MSDEFRLNTVALMPYVDTEVREAEEQVDAIADELARQIAAAGGPAGTLEEQLRAMLGAWREANTWAVGMRDADGATSGHRVVAATPAEAEAEALRMWPSRVVTAVLKVNA